MRNVFKIVTIVLIVCILGTGTALAFMPTDRSSGAPQTVWSDRGIKGTINGKVVSSLDQNTGIDGAYVGLVNPMNQGQEYANTTSDANGNFHFTGVNATYSSRRYMGEDGTTGSYQQGMIAYEIYVNKSDIGEGYSGAFGIDTNQTTYGAGPVVIYAGANTDVSPTATEQPAATDVPTTAPVTITPNAPTLEPTATEQPAATDVPTTAPATVTAVPATPIPAPSGQGTVGLLLIVAAIVLVAILVIAVYFIFLRKR